MKSKYFYICLMAMLSVSVMAQDIPNGDFSSWENRELPNQLGGGAYVTPSGYWDCTNLLIPNCVEKVEGRTAGSSAAQLTSQYLDMSVAGMPDKYITSVLATSSYLSKMSGASFAEGVPCTSLPRYLTFWYKYYPTGVDTAQVFIQFNEDLVIEPNVTRTLKFRTQITEPTYEWTMGYVDLSDDEGGELRGGHPWTEKSPIEAYYIDITSSISGLSSSTEGLGGLFGSTLCITDLQFVSSLPTPDPEEGSEIGIEEDLTNFKWTGTDTRTNVKFVLGGIGGSPSGGFFLELSPIDDTKPAQVDAQMMADKNFWTAVFARKTKEMAGEEMTVKDNVKNLTVTNVALCEDFVTDYEELKTVTLNWTRSDAFRVADKSLLFIYTRDYGEGESGINVYINYDGTEFSVGQNVFTADLVFRIHSESSVVGDALAAYKTATGSKFILDAPTAIEPVITDRRVAYPYYDLQGRRITEPTQRGLYIQNGRKVIVK